MKTQLVSMSEELAEKALTGKAKSAIVIYLNDDGNPIMIVGGLRPTDTLGIIQWCSAVVMRKLLA